MISVSNRRENFGGKRRKRWWPAFSPLSTMFSNAFSFSVVRTMESCGWRLIRAQSFTVSYTCGLTCICKVIYKVCYAAESYDVNSLPNEIFLDRYKLTGTNGRKLSKWVENTVGKGEIAHYEQFLLCTQCFQKACFSGASKVVIALE